jgi:AraC-like DNA-binding protein
MAQDSSFPLSPPPWAQRFRTDDLDEVRAFVAAAVGEHSRIVRGTGPLGFEHASLTGKSTAVGWVRNDLGVVVRGAVSDPTLHLAVPAGSTYRAGRQRHLAAANAVTFVAPGWEYTLDRPPGASAAIAIGGETLAAELAARDPGVRFDPVLRTRSIALDDDEQSGMARALRDFVMASSPASDRAAAAHAEARLVAALAGLLLECEAAVRGQEVAAARLAQLEAWIEANLEEPISIGTLCAVAGVGERALQKGFKVRRGMSPMRFVMERRLAQARRELEMARGAENVTYIAIRFGFSHTGRFAALYGQIYGESPSKTLQRSRR